VLITLADPLYRRSDPESNVSAQRSSPVHQPQAQANVESSARISGNCRLGTRRSFSLKLGGDGKHQLHLYRSLKIFRAPNSFANSQAFIANNAEPFPAKLSVGVNTTQYHT
jgi:hypothetical protein